MDSGLTLALLAMITSLLNLGVFLYTIWQRSKRDRHYSDLADRVSQIGTIDSRLRKVEYQANSNKNDIARMSGQNDPTEQRGG
jgi:hypothetical protein